MTRWILAATLVLACSLDVAAQTSETNCFTTGSPGAVWTNCTTTHAPVPIQPLPQPVYRPQPDCYMSPKAGLVCPVR